MTALSIPFEVSQGQTKVFNLDRWAFPQYSIQMVGGLTATVEVSLNRPNQNAGVVGSIAASGLLTSTGVFVDTQEVVLGSTTYLTETVFTDTADSVLIGASAAATLSNLVAAITGGAGEGTLYGTGTVINPDATASVISATTMLAVAKLGGTAGNAIASTETQTNASWSAATLLGGLAATTGPTWIGGFGWIGVAAVPTTLVALTPANGVVQLSQPPFEAIRITAVTGGTVSGVIMQTGAA